MFFKEARPIAKRHTRMAKEQGIDLGNKWALTSMILHDQLGPPAIEPLRLLWRDYCYYDRYYNRQDLTQGDHNLVLTWAEVVETMGVTEESTARYWMDWMRHGIVYPRSSCSSILAADFLTEPPAIRIWAGCLRFGERGLFRPGATFGEVIKMEKVLPFQRKAQ